MSQQDASLTLMEALLQGLNPSAVKTGPLAADAARIQGFERLGFFHGAQDVPLGALLARQVHDLTGGATMSPQELSGGLTVLLGVREMDPTKVRMLPVSPRAVEAMLSMRAVTDGELFFHQEAIRGQMRVLAVESSAPEALFEGWKIGESSWGKEGVFRIEPKVAPLRDGESVHLDYGVRAVALWSQPEFEAGAPGEPFQVGCSRVQLQMIALAPDRGEGAPHPLWRQAVEEGHTTSEKAVLLLVVMPNLSLVADLLGGPGANNVLGENLEAVYQGAHTGYSAWSEVVAKKLVEEWVAEMGSLEGLVTIQGVVRLTSEALPTFVEGRAIESDEDSSAQRSFGFAVAEWIGGLFTPDRNSGAGLVRDIIKKRSNGELLTLEVRLSGASMYLAAVALDKNGAVLGERVFK